MGTIYEATKVQLIEVFKRWNVEYLGDPKKFGKIEKGAEIEQAENFIEYLEEIKNEN